MKKVKILYVFAFVIFLLVSFPPLSLLVGMKLFCTESIFVTALGFESQANIYLPISQLIGILVIVFMQKVLNLEIRKQTEKYDDLLEKDNPSVIKNYDKFKIEIGYVVPTILAFVFAIFSYLDIYKKSGIGLLLIIFSGALQFIIAFTVFYNEIQMLIFLKKQIVQE